MPAFVRAVVLPVAVLAAGVGALIVLVATKPTAKKKQIAERGVLVEVTEVHPEAQRIEVTARGTVIPKRQVILSSEVGGRVVWMNDSLTPGGRFTAGEPVLRVDARDYRLAVEQQHAAVNRAMTELAIEKSRKEVAEKEWQRFGKEGGVADSSLARREPQLKTAEVAVKSARSGLQKAKLAVSRTVVKAPFNGLIRQREVEMGQVVAPGTAVATLVGTDAYEVEVSVPVGNLDWFTIPGVNGDQGSAVDVRQRVGDHVQTWQGRVVRLLGEVDPAGRMARVLVRIADPLNLESKPEGREAGAGGSRLPLLLGSYVEVAIAARQVDGVFAVPRKALHEDHEVYVMNEDGKLDVRDVEVLWRRPDDVLVKSGLKAGEHLVVSPIPAPVEGMSLRTEATEKTEAKAKPEPEPEPKPGTKSPAPAAETH